MPRVDPKEHDRLTRLARTHVDKIARLLRKAHGGGTTQESATELLAEAAKMMPQAVFHVDLALDYAKGVITNPREYAKIHALKRAHGESFQAFQDGPRPGDRVQTLAGSVLTIGHVVSYRLNLGQYTVIAFGDDTLTGQSMSIARIDDTWVEAA